MQRYNIGKYKSFTDEATRSPSILENLSITAILYCFVILYIKEKNICESYNCGQKYSSTEYLLTCYLQFSEIRNKRKKSFVEVIEPERLGRRFFLLKTGRHNRTIQKSELKTKKQDRRLNNRNSKRTNTIGRHKNRNLRTRNRIGRLKNRNSKRTDTIGRHKNRNFRPRNRIGRLKNRNSKWTDTIGRYKNRNLTSTDCIVR
jgi:hypothetical protein